MELPGALYCHNCGASLLSPEDAPDGTLHPFSGAPPAGSGPGLLGQEIEPAPEAGTITFVIPGSGRRVRLDLASEVRVGRSDPEAEHFPRLDLVQDGAVEAGVSRLHATISSSPQGVFIVDENSTNGTLLNNYRLPPELPYPLHSGDEIRFGRLLVHVFLE